MHHAGPFLIFLQQGLNFLGQLREMVRDDVPDDTVVDYVVTVDKDVSEGDDPFVVGYS